MSMHMCTYIYIYMYVCMYVCMYVYTNLYISMHTRKCAQTWCYIGSRAGSQTRKTGPPNHKQVP